MNQGKDGEANIQRNLERCGTFGWPSRPFKRKPDPPLTLVGRGPGQLLPEEAEGACTCYFPWSFSIKEPFSRDQVDSLKCFHHSPSPHSTPSPSMHFLLVPWQPSTVRTKWPQSSQLLPSLCPLNVGNITASITYQRLAHSYLVIFED